MITSTTKQTKTKKNIKKLVFVTTTAMRCKGKIFLSQIKIVSKEDMNNTAREFLISFILINCAVIDFKVASNKIKMEKNST